MPTKPGVFGRARTPWTALIASRMPSVAGRRVRVNRKLRGTGALAVRDGVYVLPDSPAARALLEDAQRELDRLEGEGVACLVSWLDERFDEDLRNRYRGEREIEHSRVRGHMERLHRILTRQTRAKATERRTAVARLARFEKRLARIASHHPLVHPPANAPRNRASAVEDSSPGATDFRNRSWVTRRGVLVDRIACAWMIRQFVDSRARFRFLGKGESAASGELRFDMPGGEFTHEGDRCSFESLAARFRPEDPALSAIAEIVHDLDIKDGKYGRAETAGVGRLIAGLALVEADDAARLGQGRIIFDSLYASFGSRPQPQLPKGALP